MTNSTIQVVLSEVIGGPLRDPLRDFLRDPETSQNLSGLLPLFQLALNLSPSIATGSQRLQIRMIRIASQKPFGSVLRAQHFSLLRY